MEYILKTNCITKVYGKNKAVDEVSMKIPRSSIYGFIGKNGAGKTTFMRIVAGLAKPTSGDMELFGEACVSDKQRIKIGTLIENPGVYNNLSGYENLECLRRTYGIRDKSISESLLDFVGLKNVGKKKVKNYSMGMKQRFGIAVALFRNPEFLILDEPTNGLDPEGIKEIRELLLKLNRERGITILISSHILGELSKIATHYGIIRSGKLIEEFGAEKLDERSRKYRIIAVSDVELACAILRDRLNISKYDVQEQGYIRIFEQIQESDRINRELMLGGVDIRESYTTGQDLEEYFMELLGGQE